MIGLFGLPALVPVVAILWAMPRYVPDAALREIAGRTTTVEGFRAAIDHDLPWRCRRGWTTSALSTRGSLTVRSWENDAGLLARTTIDCNGGRCAIDADAALARFWPDEIDGKRLPRGFIGCGVGTRVPVR